MKPALATPVVAAFLADVMQEAPASVERIVEGMESQAFRFRVSEGWFVIRINPSLRGFEKDRWAHSSVDEGVPVPHIVTLGTLDRDHAYCISELVSGVTLEELPPAEAASLVDEVADAWRAIASTDVSSIDGFGDFDPDGRAPSDSWRAVLHQTLSDARRDLAGLPESDKALAAYERLIDRCPEERSLIHGDFGSNNVLTEGGRITAVLDWDLAMVGDPLYDVASAYFWASHLPCMEAQASQFEQTLSQLPAYDERISCYALRIGLEEASETLRAGDLQMSAWALERLLELLAEREP
jgi:hygromycin-B 4-O-kinase